jgi:pyruvate kinase
MTGIISTIGPSSYSISTLKELAAAGMDIARLNFSHGSHEEHEEYISNIRQVNKTYKFRIKILQDLEGYRLRLGKFPEKILLLQGETIEFIPAKECIGCTNKVIPLDFDGDFRTLGKGNEIFIDDGNILLKAILCSKDKITAEVMIPGIITSYKGVNIPGMKFNRVNISSKDKADIKFGIEHKVDYVAQSFVRNRNDIDQIRKLLQRSKFNCKIIAKIENREGIDNLGEIMDGTDGIMIARGDLGVSIPIYEVPIMQKKIIKKCKELKKISITATHMLESMRHNHRPTRAEVSDVANAVLDGSGYVMLSAETAVGDYPVETLRLMKQIIDYTTWYMKEKKGV